MPASAGKQVRRFLPVGPLRRLLLFVSLRFDSRRTQLTLRVENLNRDLFFIRRLGLQIVVKDRALGRIVSHRALAVNLVGEVQTCRCGGLIEVEVLCGNGGVRLAQGTHIVENPERAAMRGGHEVIVLHG